MALKSAPLRPYFLASGEKGTPHGGTEKTMAKREAPENCPKCGSDRLSCLSGSFGWNGGETVRGRVVCLDCRNTWIVEQAVGRMLRSNEEPQGVEPSPFTSCDPDGYPKSTPLSGYSKTLPNPFCYDCESSDLEGWGRVFEGLLYITPVCGSCGCGRHSGRYYLGKAYLAD